MSDYTPSTIYEDWTELLDELIDRAIEEGEEPLSYEIFQPFYRIVTRALYDIADQDDEEKISVEFIETRRGDTVYLEERLFYRGLEILPQDRDPGLVRILTQP